MIMSDEHRVLFSQVFRESLSEYETRWIVKRWKNMQRTGSRIMMMCLENRKMPRMAEMWGKREADG